jgi:hypothetical protein
MGPVLEWRARVALDEAREEYDAIQDARREMAAKRSSRKAA